jgi:hypothetical protein
MAAVRRLLVGEAEVGPEAGPTAQAAVPATVSAVHQGRQSRDLEVLGAFARTGPPKARHLLLEALALEATASAAALLVPMTARQVVAMGQM